MKLTRFWDSSAKIVLSNMLGSAFRSLIALQNTVEPAKRHLCTATTVHCPSAFVSCQTSRIAEHDFHGRANNRHGFSILHSNTTSYLGFFLTCDTHYLETVPRSLAFCRSIDSVLYKPNSLCYNRKEGENTGERPSCPFHVQAVGHNSFEHPERYFLCRFHHTSKGKKSSSPITPTLSVTKGYSNAL